MKVLIPATILFAVLAASAAKRTEPSPLLAPKGGRQIVAGKYIVRLSDDVPAAAMDEVFGLLSGKPDHIYNHVFRGFSANLSPTLLAALQNHPHVQHIEHDTTVIISPFKKGSESRIGPSTRALTHQDGATWSLGRVSHRVPGNNTYVYDDSAGSGTCAYVLDTGVDGSHPDFEGRASMLKSFVDGEETDFNGHGTHCAGIIGSKTYGVAKNTNIYGVKVLDNSGSGAISNIIAGMDYVAQDSHTRNCPKGSVANMGYGMPYSAALNQAAAALVQSGVFLAAPAGNDATDASNISPASEPSVCTVGATDPSDQKSAFSNYGPVIKIFSPGSDIMSTWLNGNSNTISDTSSASALVSGLGAYLAGLEGFSSPDHLCRRIQDLSTKDVLTGIPSGTVNYLAFNGGNL